jgi:hypothetical protein
MKRAAASSHDLKVAFRRKPVSTTLAIVAVVVVFRIFGEFAVGVFDGLVIGFRDPI